MTNEKPKAKAVKQGKLMVSLKGLLTWSWHPLWCILYPSSNSEPAKILMYTLSDTNPPNIKELKQEVRLEKTCTIDNQIKGRLFPFRVNISKKKRIKIIAPTENERDDWIRQLCLTIPCIEGEPPSVSSDPVDDSETLFFCDNDIYESSADLSQWTITMKENEDAERIGLNGEYFISINDFNISLTDKKTDKVVCYWAYKSIRGFGRSKNSFSLEAGSSSSTGRGFFTFLSDDGEKMFEMARVKLQKMKENSHDSLSRKISNITPPKRSSPSQSQNNSLDRKQKPLVTQVSKNEELHYAETSCDTQHLRKISDLTSHEKPRSVSVNDDIYALPMKVQKNVLMRTNTQPRTHTNPLTSLNQTTNKETPKSTTYEEISVEVASVVPAVDTEVNKMNADAAKPDKKYDPYTDMELDIPVGDTDKDDTQESYAAIDDGQTDEDNTHDVYSTVEENLYDEPYLQQANGSIKVVKRDSVKAEDYDHLEFPSAKPRNSRDEDEDYAHIDDDDDGKIAPNDSASAVGATDVSEEKIQRDPPQNLSENTQDITNTAEEIQKSDLNDTNLVEVLQYLDSRETIV